jgi:hypothetical protein
MHTRVMGLVASVIAAAVCAQPEDPCGQIAARPDECGIESRRDALLASWRSTLDLLTASYFPTNYTTIRRIQRASLPHRLVVPDDFVLTKRSDLSVTARAALVGLRQLDRVETWSGGSISWAARKFSSTRERAQRLSQVIEEMMVTSGDKLADRLSSWL